MNTAVVKIVFYKKGDGDFWLNFKAASGVARGTMNW